jgi:hypothetical protein
MYTLHDDGSTEVVLVHGYFGARPQLRKAVRISVRKVILGHVSIVERVLHLETYP